MTYLTDALVEMREADVLAGTRAAVEAGASPAEVVAELQAGMRIIGDKFEAGEYYLSELVMSAEIFKGAVAALGLEEVAGDQSRGTVVLGTVQSDIHDIGKNIVASVLGANGFRVVDLGVDVPPEAFVAAVKAESAHVVGLSCLLTTAFSSMERTVAALREAGLRDQVYVMIGGGPVSADLAGKLGADDVGLSAQEAVGLAGRYLEAAS